MIIIILLLGGLQLLSLGILGYGKNFPRNIIKEQYKNSFFKSYYSSKVSDFAGRMSSSRTLSQSLNKESFCRK